MSKEITEIGCPGHFIGAKECLFRRHTQVGDSFRVSTVGNYYSFGERQPLGADHDSFFETHVFKTHPCRDDGNAGCGCHAVADWIEIDSERYATAGEAQAGHERFVAKYAKEREVSDE